MCGIVEVQWYISVGWRGLGYPYDDAQIMAPFLDYETLMRDYVLDPVVYSVHQPYYETLGWCLPVLGAPLVVLPPRGR